LLSTDPRPKDLSCSLPINRNCLGNFLAEDRNIFSKNNDNKNEHDYDDMLDDDDDDIFNDDNDHDNKNDGDDYLNRLHPDPDVLKSLFFIHIYLHIYITTLT
jgi:hypothetical protein